MSSSAEPVGFGADENVSCEKNHTYRPLLVHNTKRIRDVVCPNIVSARGPVRKSDVVERPPQERTQPRRCSVYIISLYDSNAGNDRLRRY